MKKGDLLMNTLNRYTAEYLSYCEYRKRLNFKTLKAYRIDLNQYSVFCNSSMDFLSRNTLDLYITELHKHYKPKSVKRKNCQSESIFPLSGVRRSFSTEPFRQTGRTFPWSQAPAQNYSFSFHSKVLVCTLFTKKSGSLYLSVEVLPAGYCCDWVVIRYRNADFRIMFPSSVGYRSGE